MKKVFMTFLMGIMILLIAVPAMASDGCPNTKEEQTVIQFLATKKQEELESLHEYLFILEGKLEKAKSKYASAKRAYKKAKQKAKGVKKKKTALKKAKRKYNYYKCLTGKVRKETKQKRKEFGQFLKEFNVKT